MMRALFKEKGSQFRVDIVADPAVQDFISTHASALDSSFEKEEMSDAMRRRLTRSNYIFSSMKAFHELHEAFPSLIDENGDRKSFERFLSDVRKIDATYNANYLRVEYNFVAASANMAARWEAFALDGDRYNLQYRTQRDDKVRPDHAALDRITLPIDDSFWEDFYPPNGWNCRCSCVQVLKS
ncbi:phage minor head protein, partial [uncultured Muribaculum sp.]|uniref:phage head morphogenesis protein n=1 Tax=uncultured Muribaculum sp. TaxID=1918613 RepID=UPI002659EC37